MLGEDAPCIFTASACGDINKPYEVPREDVVERISEALIDLLSRIEYAGSAEIESGMEPVECALRDFSEFQEQR